MHGYRLKVVRVDGQAQFVRRFSCQLLPNLEQNARMRGSGEGVEDEDMTPAKEREVSV